MVFSVGNIVGVAVLDVAGLCVNIWFLCTVKTRTPHLNAIDVLQVYKTALCLVALLLCVWIEFVTCSSKICVGLKALADDIFFHSTCLAFLAIAYVRYKASGCRGQASILVTHRYAFKTLLICSIPLGMFSSAIVCLMTYDDGSVEYTAQLFNRTQPRDMIYLVKENGRIAYELCHLAVFVVIPISSSVVLYYKICHSVIQAARAMEGAMTSRKNDPSKMITMSVTILLSVMISVWGIYSVVMATSLYVEVDRLFFLYWKLVVLFANPFGEGVLQKSAKKSKTRVDVVLHKGSTRHVDSAAVTDRVGSFSTANISMAEKLPALIEKRERQRKVSNVTSEEASSIAERFVEHKMYKGRRQSIFLPRTSVLIKNAAVIGLEYQGQRNNAEMNRQRKTSREGLQYELLNIENAALHRQRTRRLSNCLRFSSVNDSSDDEIYLLYRELYDRRGSKFSEKSKRSTVAQPSVLEGKALSHMTVFEADECKINESGSGVESPSQRRWRRLYTTAKTVRKFSDLRKAPTSPVIQEEPSESGQSSSEDRFSRGRIHSGMKPDTPNEPSSTRQWRLSGHQNCENKSQPKGGKKRSISCVNNVWMKNRVTSMDRKQSVSVISSVRLDAPSTSGPGQSGSRSFSYDSKIQLNYNNEDETKNQKARLSRENDRMRNKFRGGSNPEHWLLDKKVTREECIKKLMEMKEYF